MRRYLLHSLTVLVLAAATASAFASGPRLLFHESLDDGAYDGVVGRADRRVLHDATGHVNMERGTFAFFVQFDEGPDQPNWYAQLGGVGTQLGEGHYFSIMGFEMLRDDFHFSFLDAGRYAQPLRLPPVFGRWQTGEWRHLAAVWDRDEGITVYENGEPVASNWGDYRWAWNLLPRAGSIHVGEATRFAVTAGYGGRIGSLLVDEVRVYGEPLTSGQVAQLAAGKEPTGEPIAVTPAAERRERDLARLGWSGPSREALPVAAADALLGLHFARVTGAMDAKRPQAQVFEGLSRTTWPKIYYGPFVKGRHLDIELENGAVYDRVRAFVQRPFQGVLAAGAQADSDATDAAALPLETEQATYWHRRLPAGLADAPALSLRRRQGQLGQLDFYRVQPGVALPEADRRQVYALHQVEQFPDHALGRALVRETPLRFQQPVRAAREPSATWRLETPAFGGFQVFTEPPDGEARAYEGIAVHLVIDELTEPTPVRITVKEPVLSERDWLMADAVLEPHGEGRQTFTLLLTGRPVINLPAMRMTPGRGDPYDVEATGFGVRVTVADDAVWVMGENGTHIELIETDKAQALPVAAADQWAYWRRAYMTQMEGHQFGDDTVQRPLLWLAHFAQDDARYQYPLRRGGLRPEYEGFPGARFPDPVEPDNPHGAPDWALWQRAAMEQMIQEAHWRIKHNQIESGEFGSTWNDDTITVEESWIGYALALDNDQGSIKTALRRFWDGLWETSLDRRGVGRYYGSSGHYAEEGLISNSVRLLVDYGDPVTVNRVLSAAARMRHWFEKTDAGYESRSNWFGPDGVWFERSGGVRWDLTKPAGFLTWYNRHPKAVDYLTGMAGATDMDWRREPPSTFDGFTLASLLPIKEQRALAEEALVSGGRGHRRHPDVTGWLNLAGVTPAIEEARGRAFTGPGNRLAPYRALGDVEGQWQQWRITGDEQWLVDAYRRTHDWFLNYHELHTEAFPALDRVTVPSEAVINSRLGMRPSGRGTAGFLVYPLHGISYERGAREVAALVTENLHDRLDVRFYAFTDNEHELDARLWRLYPGTYEVTLTAREGDGQDGGEVLMKDEMHLQRGAPLSLTLPGRRTTELSIRPVDIREPHFDAPDPAISLDTVDQVYNRHLVIRVYNLGTQPARDVLVRVRDRVSGNIVPMGEQRIDEIEAPLDFEPRYRTVQVDNIYTMARGVIIEVDPEGEIDDLNPYNNRVVLEDGHVQGAIPIGAERRKLRTGAPHPQVYGR